MVVVVVIVCTLNMHVHIQSVPITADAVRSIPTHDEMHTMQHHVTKCVNDLRKVTWLSVDTLISSTNKPDSHDMSKIYGIMPPHPNLPDHHNSPTNKWV